MEEWKEYKLGEVCTKIGSGATPKGGKEAYRGGDTSLIRSQNVLDFSFSCDGLAFINDEQATKLNGVELKEGDVLLNITGDSVARACIVPKNILPARVNQHVSIVRGDNSKVLNEYILYFLQYKKPYLLSISQGGATRNALTKGMIEDLSIQLPDLTEQRQIASILSSLDDKIELNRRINENLEAQAQALFKSWFVDFEPFRDGEFVESELGMIPKGWRVGSLSEFAEISKSSVNPQKQPQTAFVHYSIPSYDDGMKPEIQLGEEIKSNKFVIANQMTLFSKLNPRIKRVWYVDNLPPNSVCSTEFVPYKAKEEALSSFLHGLINSQGFYDFVMAMVNGATGSHQRFHPEDSLKYQIAYNEVYVNNYCRFTNPILNRILTNNKESRRLATLRDTLLPRLMSGELKVNEIA